MNKTLLSAALIAGFGIAAFAPQAARATDGTITITGAINAVTCKVGTGSPNNVAVVLPTVSNTAFTGAGSVAGSTGFNIVVSGCATSQTSATTYFENGATDSTDGNLKNAGGTATNVEVQLLNGSGGSLAAGSVIALNAPAATQNSSVYTLVTSGTTKGVTLNYYAQYYATAATAPTAGTVSTTVQYSMIYQ
jgi:major type 1 subunit fimbrin (pilin)